MHQWWPSMRRPEGTGDWPQGPTLDSQGRSANVVTTEDVAAMGGLCTAVFSVATPCVLGVQVTAERTSLDTYIRQSTDFPAKSRSATGVAGQLVIEYGSAGVLETIVMDLKNGSFQFPPCEQVKVFFNTSIDDVGTDIPPIRIAATLVPGLTTAPTEPTYTIVHGALTTAGYTTQIPDRARYVDLWQASSGHTLNYGTAGSPVLFLTGDKQTPLVVRDYTTGVFVPPYPASMCIQSDNAETGVTLDTTVNCEAVCQFTLEL